MFHIESTRPNKIVPTFQRKSSKHKKRRTKARERNASARLQKSTKGQLETWPAAEWIGNAKKRVPKKSQFFYRESWQLT